MGRRVAIGLGVLVAVAVSAVVLVHHYTGTGYIQDRLTRSLAQSTDSLYRIRIGSSQVSLIGRSLRLANIALLPDSAELKSRTRSGRSPGTRVAFTANSLTLEGVDLWALVRGGLVARSAVIESPRVLIDRVGQVAPPGGRTPAKMPHELLATIRQVIRIDTLRVARGDVSFSEQAMDGVRPGTIRFADLSLTACNITNRRDPKKQPTPAVAEVHMLLAGVAPAEVHLVYDLFSPELLITYGGTVGGMAGLGFNELLMNLEGFRVTKGQLDSARFQISVEHDVAVGEVVVLYHDLKVATVNKDTHKRGLSRRLGTAINNKFNLRRDNPDEDEPALSVSVRLRRPLEASFMRLLWSNIRYGLQTTLAS